jgi:hypothetical protein
MHEICVMVILLIKNDLSSIKCMVLETVFIEEE